MRVLSKIYIICNFALLLVAEARADDDKPPPLQIEMESEIEFQGIVSACILSKQPELIKDIRRATLLDWLSEHDMELWDQIINAYKILEEG